MCELKADKKKKSKVEIAYIAKVKSINTPNSHLLPLFNFFASNFSFLILFNIFFNNMPVLFL